MGIDSSHDLAQGIVSGYVALEPGEVPQQQVVLVNASQLAGASCVGIFNDSPQGGTSTCGATN